MNPRHWRPLTWAILIFTVVMGLAFFAVDWSEDCDKPTTGQIVNTCSVGETAEDLVFGAFLAFVWIIGTAVLCAAWLVTWATRPRCPICRRPRRRNAEFCLACGYDFVEEMELLVDDDGEDKPILTTSS